MNPDTKSLLKEDGLRARLSQSLTSFMIASKECFYFKKLIIPLLKAESQLLTIVEGVANLFTESQQCQV